MYLFCKSQEKYQRVFLLNVKIGQRIKSICIFFFILIEEKYLLQRACFVENPRDNGIVVFDIVVMAFRDENVILDQIFKK